MAGPTNLLRRLAALVGIVPRGDKDQTVARGALSSSSNSGLEARVARVLRERPDDLRPPRAPGEPWIDQPLPTDLASLPGPPVSVSEPLAVVLRRQVPIRYGEAPRSWLGGLPMMPHGVEWPRGHNPEKREQGARPLHFVAQIACADLPAELWDGLGPREGWLLFFLDNNASDIEGPEQNRVIHTSTLGHERQPPPDIGPVHDGAYTGSQFISYMDQADVPSVWRRWPVDLVAFPNKLYRDGPRSFGTPPDFAAILYAALPVGGDRDRAPVLEPFSWRCLQSLPKALRAASAASSSIHPNEARLREKLVAQGPLSAILDMLDAHKAKFDASETGRLLAADPTTIEETQLPWLEKARQSREARLASRAKVAQLISLHPTHDAMLAFLEAERMRRVEWRADALERLVALDEALRGTAPDTRLEPSRWVEIRALLEADGLTSWFAAYGRNSSVILEEREETSWQHFSPRIMSAVPEIAADCYVDPERSHLLPVDAVALLEPWWRRLYNNRPHRMGGFHDGVQSDAEEGPTAAPLLMQLATDDAMQWCWGDAGAIYWFAPIEGLAGGTFDQIDCHLECH